MKLARCEVGKLHDLLQIYFSERPEKFGYWSLQGQTVELNAERVAPIHVESHALGFGLKAGHAELNRVCEGLNVVDEGDLIPILRLQIVHNSMV